MQSPTTSARLCASDAVDILFPIGEQACRAEPVAVRVGGATTPAAVADVAAPSVCLTGLGVAPRSACLVRLALPGAAHVDCASLEARLRALPVPASLVDTLALALREYFVDERARVHGWTDFDGVEAGGLARGDALAALPRNLVAPLVEAIAPHAEASVHGALDGTEAPAPRTSRERAPWSSPRRILLHGEQLAVRVDPAAGTVTLGRLAPGAPTEAALDAPLAAALLPPAPDTDAASHTFTIANDTGALVVDLSALASLLRVPVLCAEVSRLREARASAGNGFAALRPVVAALVVGALERPSPVTAGRYPPPRVHPDEEALRLWTPGAPPEASVLLRARGYRFMEVPERDIVPSWWVDIAPEHLGIECAWLREEVYKPFRHPLFLRIGPVIPGPIALRRVSGRRRADPAECK